MKASDLSKAVWASACAVSLAILPLALSACTQSGTNDGGGTGSDTTTTPGGTTGGTGTTGSTGTTGGTTGTTFLAVKLLPSAASALPANGLT